MRLLLDPTFRSMLEYHLYPKCQFLNPGGGMRQAQTGPAQGRYLEASKVGDLVALVVAVDGAQRGGPAVLHGQQPLARSLLLVCLHSVR